MSFEERSISSAEKKKVYDVPHDPEELRERFFAQEPTLLKAANELANTVKALPRDPAHPDTEPRALVVGGFVRDAMLGKHPKDADLEIYGVSAARLESLLHQLFPERVNAVGEAFGVYKVALGEGLEFDISIPRRESKTGERHNDIAVQGDPGMSVEDAARRRDFTFNALAADPLTGDVVDPFGGLEDLRTGTLRVTDAERFQDDPLRVYRAVQFTGRMGLRVEPETKALLKEMVERGQLDHLPKERVTEEVRKLMLKSERPSSGWELARELGITERYYPELHAMIDVPQDPEWHPEGDVWIHTMMVVDEAAKIIRQPERELTETEKLQVMLGALCHDLGKPSTTEKIDGRIRSRGHEEAGEAPTRELFTRWTFGKEIEDASVIVATEHLKPSMHGLALEQGKITEAQYTNTIRKLLRRIHPVSWKVLVASSEADSRGRTIPGAQTNPYRFGERLAQAVQEGQLDAAPKQTLLQGRDLIALGVKPGPDMGRIIRAVEEARDEGRVQTQEEALALAKSLLTAS